MAHQLIEIRQESRSTLGVAAHHILEAIEGYKPWESMGIRRNDYSQMAAMGELKELAQFHHDTMRHKAKAEKVLRDKWGSNWRRQLQDLSPPSDSTHYLWELAKVATLVALPESIKLFRFLVDRPKKNPQRGISKETHLKPGDLRILRGTIERKIPSESSFGITLSPTPNSDKVGVGPGDQNPDTQSEPTEARHLVATRERNGHNHHGFDHDNDGNNDGNNNGESWWDSDGSNNDGKSWGDSDGGSQHTSPRTAKRVKGPYRCDCQERLGPVVLLIEKLDPKAIGDCQEVLRELIFSDHGYEDEFDGEHFTQLCSRHRQRTLARLGLQTNMFSHQAGLAFLRQMRAHVEGLDEFRMDDSWYKVFQMSAREQWPEDLLGVCQFTWVPPLINYGDRRKSIFEEIAGQGSWLQFQEEGTLNTDMFDWLINNAEIRPMILEEFACYRYHLRDRNGRPNRGWGRNMFHSVIQQRAGDSTFFRHVDLSPARYIHSAGTQGGFSSPKSPYPTTAGIGRGDLTIQGGVAIDDETAEGGCTEVVKGFHQRIGSWWTTVEEQLVKKGLRPPTGLVTNLDSHVWTKDDEHKYGSFIPVPMEAGQAQITMAKYTGIQDDHQTLDQMEAGTWEPVAGAHRDFVPEPCSGPSGYPHMYGCTKAFGGCVSVRGVAPICDALVSGCKYTDFVVLGDVACLLGEDKIAAARRVNEIRKVLLVSYQNWYSQSVKMEQLAYSSNSYYYVNGSNALGVGAN
ncbi:hypothetical protein EV426DRAFT_579136 [Tirmania nivea]|nr:hypothetical protein EV426DRAFT_579136 [Tirmania nivea]